MASSRRTGIQKQLAISEKRIAILQKGYKAILDFIDEMEQLSQFQDKIAIPAHVNEIWKVLLGDIRNLIDAEICALFLVNDYSLEFELEAVEPQSESLICEKEIAFQIESGMFSWVINRRQAAIIPSLVFKNNQTVIMLPLTTIKHTLGAVLVITAIEASSITQENLKLLNMLAKQCSLVMENAFLYERLTNEHESLLQVQTRIFQAEKLASIGRLTSGAFHEMLNPLNIVSGYIQLLLVKEEIGPDVLKKLKVMLDQAERMERIVKGMLQFSCSSGIERRKININELIENVIRLVAYEFTVNNIEIVTMLAPHIPLIAGDPESLCQLFLHLFSNARDAMVSGGTLQIVTTGAVPEGEDDFIEIRIRDNGNGIRKDDLTKVFDPFFSTKETGKGAGLGLAISYGIIQDHGGTIHVESEEDEGTAVVITLPSERKMSRQVGSECNQDEQ
ncbi:MAG: GAF domain-containing protein [Deltaproteobacteria bacterium]|nr:GAF domain-containing protein [Deltaproteobacteria bacterium]